MATDIKTRITAEDGFSRTFAALRRDVAGVQQSLSGVGAVLGSVLRVGTLGAVAGVGAFALAARNLVNELDALNDSADATGATVESLSALEDVARRNGATLDLVTDAITKMNQALITAKPGSDQEKALQAIGLEASKLRALAPDQALLTIARALAQFENDGNKARVAQILFGRSIKEIAPFLNDLATAGELNARVTSDQAAEAERFNKQLAQLQTNVSNAGRALVAGMLPALNETIDRVRIAREVFGGFGGIFQAALGEGGRSFENAADGVAFYAKQLADVRAKRERMAREPNAFARLFAQDNLGQEIARLEKLLDFYTRVGTAQKSFAGAGRGFVNPPLVSPPRVADFSGGAPGGTQAARISEAERYLESLQRQVEKTQDLSAVEQLQLDIRKGRIDGLTPSLQAQLEQEARRLDAIRAQGQALRDQQDDLDRLIQTSLRGADELDRLLASTPTGRRQDIERQVDRVLAFARANPGDERAQRQASEVLTRLRGEFDALDEAAVQTSAAWDKVADTIDKGLDRATGAILDFAIEGKGTFGDIGRSMARDIARGLIEDPLRAELKSFGKLLADGLNRALRDEKAFDGVAAFFKSLIPSGSGGGDGFWGNVITTVAGWFGGAGTTRALGGPVKSGQLVRWQENGREWFVPQQDGTVVTEGQMRRGAAAAGGAVVNYAPVVHVNGDVGPGTVALVQAMLDRNNTRLVRSLRTGGLMAG